MYKIIHEGLCVDKCDNLKDTIDEAYQYINALQIIDLPATIEIVETNPFMDDHLCRTIKVDHTTEES